MSARVGGLGINRLSVNVASLTPLSVYLIPLLALAACQEEEAQNTDPLPLTPETVGHFCQMNLMERVGPKGQVHLVGMPGIPFYFSQVSDLVVYLRLSEQTRAILAV